MGWKPKKGVRHVDRVVRNEESVQELFNRALEAFKGYEGDHKPLEFDPPEFDYSEPRIGILYRLARRLNGRT
jgi:hypothetical protein